ncbi:MAG: hypothetical protein J7K40_01690 [candidate division Zixibacteria bacterium]|nr:hypothetical protein [candidate division Zixibacteria bacterium]
MNVKLFNPLFPFELLIMDFRACQVPPTRQNFLESLVRPGGFPDDIGVLMPESSTAGQESPTPTS